MRILSDYYWNANILDGGQLDDNDHSGINISDVIEVIQTTDPTASVMFPSTAGMDGACGGGGGSEPTGISNMEQYNGNANITQQMQQYQQVKHNELKKIKKEAYVKIIEQPAGKALRFRYECEGRSAGSIPGVKSTPENKTFPTIEIVGYKGPAVVVVSCVTKDQPYRPHPHNLVGKESCKRGVCTVEIKSDTMRAVFSNLGIQCVKKKDIENALRVREEIRVDPFKTGFSHRFQPSSLDLNSVRLCFQVFVENDKKGRFQFPLPPVVSDPIYDKKAMSDLVICTLCSCSSTVAGGKEIILLCEKVAKEDISVRFFEEHDGQTDWEGYGDFQHTDVHKQTAIKFRTPSYRTLDINQPVKVFIQLRRPSDGATSEPLPFDYLPLDSDPAVLKRKRQKINGDPMVRLPEYYQQQNRMDYQLDQNPQILESRASQQLMTNNPFLNIDQGTIKVEPRDSSPSPYMFASYRIPDQSPSPQPISPQNLYINTPSPYSLGGGNSNVPNNQLISPNNNNNNNTNFTTTGGNISPNLTMTGLPDFNPFHQQQPQFSGLNYNTWNNDNNNGTGGDGGGGTASGYTKKQNPTNLNFNITNNNNNGSNNSNNNNNNNNNNDVQQQWNLSTALRQSINNYNMLNNNTQNGNIQNHINQTQSHSNSINLGHVNTGEAPNLSSLLDMDSEQLIHLNSAELRGLSLS